jgi:hypothetical protein
VRACSQAPLTFEQKYPSNSNGVPQTQVVHESAPIRGTERNGAMPSVSDWAQVRAAAAVLPNVAHGHYAIQVRDFECAATGGGGLVWKFYKVDKPQRGAYKGRTYLSVQASDDFHLVRGAAAQLAIFQAIGFNPQKAMTDYGHQLGRCGICHRTLTDPESIARGIGPVCAGKIGW